MRIPPGKTKREERGGPVLSGRLPGKGRAGRGAGRPAPPDREALAMSSLHSLQCLELFKLKM